MAPDDEGATPDLPSGLVTFVFTDIEASTRLYKALGDEVAGDVFDLHNDLLRRAWNEHHGHEVHTEGDSFFVAFENADDAVAACVQVQRLLAQADWPAGSEVRVRIGIHCGLGAPRNGDYMALAVHQAARVMSAANGNQILITDAVLQRLESNAPDTSMVRTGAFRLRDFDDAPVLHRVDVSGLDSNDHPPRATPANHHNLVPRLTSFVGRHADVVAINGLLQQGSAVTVVGLGGMGKTRLATEVGLEVAAAWTDGAWMVELAEVSDPELIAEEVAASIGVDKASVGDRWNDVTEFVGDKTMLLILDNVEHLIEDCARLVPQLLRSCANVTVLSTSREPLNCQGEVVYRLQPLELSPDADDPTSLPSVELFIDRARAVATHLVWTPEALDDVLEICQHLDGLPLAIEIAAAQAAVLQLPEIRAGLSNRFRLLRSRDRALPERQRTMEGLLGWSYQLLTETEQRAFRRLAVFAGSFSIDAAEAALAGDGIAADDVPELIWNLVDKSLIAADLSDSATRYRLFESVQHYGMRLLIDNDDPVRSAEALAQWLLERVAPWQVNDRRWLGEVDIELANIRAVVELIANSTPEVAQQLMCSLGRYHDTRQSFATGIDEVTRACDVLPLETQARVAMLAMLSDLHLRMGEHDVASGLLNEANELQKTTGPPAWDDMAVQRSMGEVLLRTGDPAAAIQLAESALAGDPSDRGAARMWNLLGIARSIVGDLSGALEAGQHELVAHQALGHASYVGPAFGNLAETAWRLGDSQTAASHQQASLAEAITLGQHVLIAYSLIMAARFNCEADDWAEAVLLQACAEQTLSESGHQLYAEDLDAARQLERDAIEALGSEGVGEATAAGQQLSLLDAAELAKAAFERVTENSTTQIPK